MRWARTSQRASRSTGATLGQRFLLPECPRAWLGVVDLAGAASWRVKTGRVSGGIEKSTGVELEEIFPFSRLMPFQSSNPKLYNLSRLRAYFEHMAGYSFPERLIKQIVERKNFSKPDQEEFFKTLQHFIDTSGMADLESAKAACANDIEGRISGLRLSDKGLVLTAAADQEALQNIFAGKGEARFAIQIFLLIHRRLEDIYLINETHAALGERHAEISAIRSHKAAESELVQTWDLRQNDILKRLADLMNDSSMVSARSDMRDQKENARAYVRSSRELIRRELTNLEPPLSRLLVCKIRAKYAENVPADSMPALRNNLQKLQDTLDEQLGQLNQLMELPYLKGDGDIKKDFSGVLTTLLFARTIPQSFEQCSKERRTRQQLDIFPVFANLLQNVSYDLGQEKTLTMDADLNIEGLVSIKGKSLGELVELLAQIGRNRKINPFSLQTLYDRTLSNIEQSLISQPGAIASGTPLGTLKKWLVYIKSCHVAELVLLKLDRLRSSIRESHQLPSGESGVQFLPQELLELLRYVCFVSCKLLQRDNEISRQGDAEYQEYLRLDKSKIGGDLNRVSGMLRNQPLVLNTSVGAELERLLDDFTQIYREVRKAQSDLARFELMIKEELVALGKNCSILDGLQDRALITDLLNRPRIKNQSWNRLHFLRIVKICNSL